MSPPSYEEQESRIWLEELAREIPDAQKQLVLLFSVAIERAMARAQRRLAVARIEAAREDREPRPDPSGIGE